MSSVWRDCLADRYQAAIEVMESVLRECPEELWERSVWNVKLSDRHVWPIKGKLGAELPDSERLQLHSAFWLAAYHAISALHGYLDGGREPPVPPPPLTALGPHELPAEVFRREQLLDYLRFCQNKANAVLRTLSEEAAEALTPKRRPFADLLLHNLMHFHEHVAQLNLFLNLNGDWSDSRWRSSDRWFSPCPDCEVP